MTVSLCKRQLCTYHYMYSSAVNVTYINIFYNKKEINEKTYVDFPAHSSTLS